MMLVLLVFSFNFSGQNFADKRGILQELLKKQFQREFYSVGIPVGKADGFGFCFIHEAFICIDQQLHGKLCKSNQFKARSCLH